MRSLDSTAATLYRQCRKNNILDELSPGLYRYTLVQKNQITLLVGRSGRVPKDIAPGV